MIPADLPGQRLSTRPNVSSTPWLERRIVGITFAVHDKRQQRLSCTESATSGGLDDQDEVLDIGRDTASHSGRLAPRGETPPLFPLTRKTLRVVRGIP